MKVSLTGVEVFIVKEGIEDYFLMRAAVVNCPPKLHVIL